MVRVCVHYDINSRNFRILETGSVTEEGNVYILTLSGMDDLKLVCEFDLWQSEIAHA